ncbi:MAG: hypothetical protein VYB08_06680, partial [Candidatus Latescibacterota bacterium]|nr:hypothetical protein [Candidatus Latescibacterota bacterium]
TAADGSRYFAIELDDPLAEDYPAVHRLDARLNRTFRVAGGRRHAFFEVTNVYDHDNVSSNVFFIDCGGSPNPEDSSLRKEEDLWFGLLPSLGLSWTWDL